MGGLGAAPQRATTPANEKRESKEAAAAPLRRYGGSIKVNFMEAQPRRGEPDPQRRFLFPGTAMLALECQSLGGASERTTA